jgi:hypothetical protein
LGRSDLRASVLSYQRERQAYAMAAEDGRESYPALFTDQSSQVHWRHATFRRYLLN